MRLAISYTYPGIKWQQRVSNMPDNQVCAIYYKFLESGKIDKHKTKKQKTEKPEYYQYTIFDYI